MTDKLRQAIEQAVAILGPEAPLCSGCVDEWTEALRILNDALAWPQGEPVYWEYKHVDDGPDDWQRVVPRMGQTMEAAELEQQQKADETLLRQLLELLMVATFHSPELQAKRTELIDAGLGLLK